MTDNKNFNEEELCEMSDVESDCESDCESNTDEGKWVDLIVDEDYEIWDQYPHPIRRKTNQYVIKEHINKRGYVRCLLNQKNYPKHRLIALQFIKRPTDNTEVDHINRNRSDNRIENLRWISHSENNKNRTSTCGIEYEFVDDISGESIVADSYGKYEFDDLYYHENTFYFYNGLQYRKLHINEMKNGCKYINAYDTDSVRRKIFYSKFKRERGII